MALIDNNVIADMHVHLTGNSYEKDYFGLLDSAEENGVKCLTILEYNHLRIFSSGVFYEIMDKISDHYSGKLVSGVEFLSLADEGLVGASGFNYAGFRCDIILYDFDPEKLLSFLRVRDEVLLDLWEQDKKIFVEKLNSCGFFPPEEIFVNDGRFDSYIRKYFLYLLSNESEKTRFIERFKLKKLGVPSDISRNLVSNPSRELYFRQKVFFKTSEILEIAKQIGAKVCLTHPAYMSTMFDTEDYLRTMVNFSKSEPEKFEPITMTSGAYMLDRKADTEVIDKLADEFNLIKIPSSDARNNDENGVMHCQTHINGELKMLFYQSRPGFAICPFLDEYLDANGGKVDDFQALETAINQAEANLVMDKKAFEMFKDVRDYYG